MRSSWMDIAVGGLVAMDTSVVGLGAIGHQALSRVIRRVDDRLVVAGSSSHN